MDTLAAYAESPEAGDVSEVRRHLTGCASCRKAVAGVQQVRAALLVAPPLAEPDSGTAHPTEGEIAAYVEGMPVEDRTGTIPAHLEACGACMKAALHFAAHSTTMRDALGANAQVAAAGTSRGRQAARGRARIWAGVTRALECRVPAWVGIPATVVAVALVVAVWSGGRFGGGGDGHTLAVYQDEPVIIFTPTGDAPPGIGFFGAAREKSRPFEGIQASMGGQGRVHLRWPQVEDALDYTVRLYLVGADGSRMVGEAQGNEPEAVIPTDGGLVPGRRYEWRLTGTTHARGTFMATGGFVLTSAGS